jgi:uncharacterized surface protein with fasciclin (FAS1) repeats
MSARATVLAAAAALALLGGCSQDGAGDEPLAATSDAAADTVAAAVAGSGEHRKLAAALTGTQLSPVLDGKGDYTLLAPSDAAFAALGDKGEALAAQDQRPLMIAVLRGHILPGQVTPKAIEAAIARKQGPVEMRTMAGSTVTFAKADRGFTVSNGRETAVLATATTAASNGAVLPIDKVLMPAQ